MGIKNCDASYTGLVQKYIGTAYDHVKLVAENMDAILNVGHFDFEMAERLLIEFKKHWDSIEADVKAAHEAAVEINTVLLPKIQGIENSVDQQYHRIAGWYNVLSDWKDSIDGMYLLIIEASKAVDLDRKAAEQAALEAAAQVSLAAAEVAKASGHANDAQTFMAAAETFRDAAEAAALATAQDVIQTGKDASHADVSATAAIAAHDDIVIMEKSIHSDTQVVIDAKDVVLTSEGIVVAAEKVVLSAKDEAVTAKDKSILARNDAVDAYDKIVPLEANTVSKALAAAASASAALVSQKNAVISATDAETSAVNAKTSETHADAAALAATNEAADAAATFLDVLKYYGLFKDNYIGHYPYPPVENFEGMIGWQPLPFPQFGPFAPGTLYWDTKEAKMHAWDFSNKRWTAITEVGLGYYGLFDPSTIPAGDLLYPSVPVQDAVFIFRNEQPFTYPIPANPGELSDGTVVVKGDYLLYSHFNNSWEHLNFGVIDLTKAIYADGTVAMVAPLRFADGAKEGSISYDHIQYDNLSEYRIRPNHPVNPNAGMHLKTKTGEMGIGMPSTSNMLSVRGDVLAEGVIRTLNNGTSEEWGQAFIHKSFNEILVNGIGGIVASATQDEVNIIGGNNITLEQDIPNKAITIIGDNTVYTHPAFTPRVLDSTADPILAGAEVVSKVGMKLDMNGEGHVQDASLSILKRTLTLTDLGFTGAGDANKYTHPDFTAFTFALAGNKVLDGITVNKQGHITSLGVRTLSLANLGFTGSSNANDYVHPKQVAISTDFIGAHVPSRIEINGEGHVTRITSRILTPGSIKAATEGAVLHLSNMLAHLNSLMILNATKVELAAVKADVTLIGNRSAQLTGATFTGAVSGITPVQPQHFTTKKYVDDAAFVPRIIAQKKIRLVRDMATNTPGGWVEFIKFNSGFASINVYLRDLEYLDTTSGFNVFIADIPTIFIPIKSHLVIPGINNQKGYPIELGVMSRSSGGAYLALWIQGHVFININAGSIRGSATYPCENLTSV